MSEAGKSADRLRVEIRLAGLGGQGIVMAGAILGQAATEAGLVAAGSSSYGSQARGGACRGDVVVARSGSIDFPHVHRPDLLAVMSDEAYRAYLPGIAPRGVVLWDGFQVKPDPASTVAHREVSATRLAMEATGKAQVANIVMLAAVVALTGLVSREALRTTLHGNFAARFHAANDLALDLGIEIGERLRSLGVWP